MKVKEGVFVDRFDDMNIFLKTIKRRPFNTVFKDYPDGRGSEDDDYSFSKTKSYQESEEIMKIGYKEGLENLKKAEKNIPVCSKASKAVPTASVIGYTPHVPNAIAGIPCSMISHKQVVMKTKMLSVVYDMTASHYVKADDFVKAGRVLLSFIEMVELKGYRVRLDMMLSACKNSEKSVALIKVKDFRQPVNPLKLSYMMLHPSFLRRQGLKWIETNPDLTDRGFRYSYGTALYYTCGKDTRSESKWLKDNGIIGANDVFVSFYDLKSTDHIALAKTLGLKQ
jgi:hypothetical protein